MPAKKWLQSGIMQAKAARNAAPPRAERDFVCVVHV
jgi:hypothetical protein